MLGETVCHINRPGLTLMRGVKALREGRIHEKRGRGAGQKKRDKWKMWKGRGKKETGYFHNNFWYIPYTVADISLLIDRRD